MPSPRRARRQACRPTESQPGLTTYESLEPRLALSVVQVIAAGFTNQESLTLQINGATAAVWNNLGGDGEAGSFVTLSHSTSSSVSASQVRLAFTNDLYDPANGIDRNVRVDAIVIDGFRYETEAAETYSTGTWLPADGVVPGYRKSEYLHANGYFQYALGSGQAGTLIQIRAAGDEGGEQMELRIDGTTFSSFVVTTDFANYSYRAANSVLASQVQVVFVNDLWEPALNIDRNLRVDWISLDGTTYETEAPTVYSTGTWQNGLGIQPGYWQSQTLHSNGYFEFQRNPQPGGFRLATNTIRTAENNPVIAVEIQRLWGADGTVSVAYQTVAGSAADGQDFVGRSGRVTFLAGEVSRTVFVSILDNLSAEADEQFAFVIDNAVGGATLLSPRTATITIEDNDAVRGNGTGLLAEYFDDEALGSRFSQRIDPTVDFSWGSGAPVSGMGADTFSVRWAGRIEPTANGTWTFRVSADDGARLWINNQLVVDGWNGTGTTVWAGVITLEAARLYDLRMEVFEATGNAFAKLQWSGPGQALETVPRRQLYPGTLPPPDAGSQLITEDVYTGLDGPVALDFSADGRNQYIGEFRGAVRVARDGQLLPAPVLEFSDRVNGYRGLSDIAIHPDLANYPFLYLSYTYDPPEVQGQPAGSLAGPDGQGNRAGRVTRVTLDAATGYTTILPNSEVVILGRNSTWNNFNGFVNSTVDFNEPPAGILPDGSSLRDFVATDSDGHFIDAVEFGPDGKLHVSIGDGTSYNRADPRTARVQDVNNLSGKILRIDPVTGNGIAGNPFFDGDVGSNRSKVWQYGLRNPYRIAFDPQSGQTFVGDVGWSNWEEINAAGPGANFGWPWYEGGNGNSLRTNGYQDLPAAATFYASGTPVTASRFALNHAASGIDALVLGDFYTGNSFPAEYRNSLFFAELGSGKIHNLRFNSNGTVASDNLFATGHDYVLQIKQGPDGSLYFVDLNDDRIGRWSFVGQAPTAQAAGTRATGAPVGERAFPSIAGNGVIVATIDSGIRTTLPEFAGRLWQNVGEVANDGIDNDGNGYIDDVNGYDFVLGRGALSDGNGHGTAIASLIAGNSLGAARNARLMPLRVLDDNGNGSPTDVARAIRFAASHGARIICLPVSVNGGQEIRDAIEFATQRGALIVVAAGNNGATDAQGMALLSAVRDGLLAVGAVDASGTRLPESNRVGTAQSRQIDADGIAYGRALDGSVTTWRGTSIAAALASGTAAVALSINPDLNARQLRELLQAAVTMPGSGSDSVGLLNPELASAMASRTLRIAFQPEGSRLTIRGTPGDDLIRYAPQEPLVIINGIGYLIPNRASYSAVIVDGGTGNDRLNLIGTLGGSDYGLLRPGYGSLTTAGQFVRGANFERLQILAGDGNTTLDVYDSTGDDQLKVVGGELVLSAAGFSLAGANFRNSRVYASSGFDSATVIGTSANERLLARPDFARLVRGQTLLQANLFDSVVAEMRAGFDSVILEGSYRDESVTLRPDSARLDGAGFSVTVAQLEQTTSYGHGGYDVATFLDGPGTEFVNSWILNTLVVGPGYDHRLYSFERTTLNSNEGQDQITFHGSEGRELLESSPASSRLTGAGFETIANGFGSVLMIGLGGADEARLAGSTGYDSFWSSPTQSALRSSSFSLTTLDFGTVFFQGNGGGDLAEFVDGAGNDQLALRRSEATLSGAGYQITVRDIQRLRARSLIDNPVDTLQFLDTDLDYQFERFGDWLG